MTSDHHDLVLQFGIGSGNFGNGVEAVLVVSSELGFDVHLDRDGNVVLEQPKDAAVALNLGNHYGKGHSRIAVIRSPAECGAVVVKEDAGASAVLGRRGWER